MAAIVQAPWEKASLCNSERNSLKCINNIYLYAEEDNELLEHELIHCLLMNDNNINFPTFISEGITASIASLERSQVIVFSTP